MKYEWLLIPFNESEMLVEIKYPKLTQIPEACRLNIINEKLQKCIELTRQEIIDRYNIQEQCCRVVLNRPTFQELEIEVHGRDNVLEYKRKKLAELEEKLKSISSSEKEELHRQIDDLKISCGNILPDNTMTTLTNIAYGVDISDLKTITKEKLLLAYSKARLFSGKPSDYVSGLFTDGDRQNIDNYATFLGGEEEINRNRNRGK